MTLDRNESPSEYDNILPEFAKWLDLDEVLIAEFFGSGVVVCDANVLLALYRISADARRQVLETFDRIGDRMWVPYQAVVEFNRNRGQAIAKRIGESKAARSAVRAAIVDAVASLEQAVEQVVNLRARSFSGRPWDPTSVGLDRNSFESRLAGVLDEAIVELDRLDGEHDLDPKDMRQPDSVLAEISTLLKGKIGRAYPIGKLKELVDEAENFRFPNRMPPGYMDVKDKDTPLRRAGDYILWRQVIDKAEMHRGGKVVLITNDVKEDWWLLDKSKKRVGMRPELAQELWDYSGCELLVLTLADFFERAGEFLESSISDETVRELREVLPKSAAMDALDAPDDRLDFDRMSLYDFEDLVGRLFLAMGFDVVRHDAATSEFDFIISRGDGLFPTRIGVEVKRSRGALPSAKVRAIHSRSITSDVSSVTIVAASTFTAAARVLAQKVGVELIDGDRLKELLLHYVIGSGESG